MQVWLEVQIETHADAADLVAAAVAPLTGGVELRDTETLLSAAAGRTCVVALCQPDRARTLLDAVDEAMAAARAAGTAVDPVTIRTREAHEDEWRDVWKQFFRATRVGRRFTVRPSWDAGEATPGEFVIDLDPGMAFGTGAHPSTRLAIELAEEIREARPDLNHVLDLGCGSGILSIVAARLWPQASGLAADNDPQATICAKENLERNHVGSFEVRASMLAELAGRFDLVMANIQADVLTQLAPEMPARLAQNGLVILSGLLLEQVEPLLAVYRDAGFTLNARADEGDWGAVCLRRIPGP
ncbi:MAG: 50S ribosomal protein L11 methyltransferase [Polyangia bacterium]|jgi:ribosomal protein L11 methyltransferase